MSTPVIAVTIKSDDLLFEATKDGYISFVNVIKDLCKQALDHPPTGVTNLMVLENAWAKYNPYFSDIANQAQSDFFDTNMSFDEQASWFNLVDHQMRGYFSDCYKNLSEIIAASQSQAAEDSVVDTEPVDNGNRTDEWSAYDRQRTELPRPVITPTVIDQPALPRIIVDWNALASNRSIRWGFAGAIVGGAVAWFFSSRSQGRIEDRQ